MAHLGDVRPHLVGVEEPAYRQAAVQDLVARVHRRTPAAGIRTIRPSKDKTTRALLPAARAEAGLVFVDQQAPWYPVFEAECLGFPLAKYDDQVDAFSGACLLAMEHLTRLRQCEQGPQRVELIILSGDETPEERRRPRRAPRAPAAAAACPELTR